MATPTPLPSTFADLTTLPAASLNNLRGAFRILQVVYGTTATSVTNTTNTFVDTGLTASITCQSTTSKVLVMVSQNGCFKRAANAENRIRLRLLRGGTDIAAITGDLFLYTGTAIGNGGSASISVLDSPASISAQTYKTQFMNPVSVDGVLVQENNGRSTIMLLEVSA
jgi:hypothetical protein